MKFLKYSIIKRNYKDRVWILRRLQKTIITAITIIVCVENEKCINYGKDRSDSWNKHESALVLWGRSVLLLQNIRMFNIRYRFRPLTPGIYPFVIELFASVPKIYQRKYHVQNSNLSFICNLSKSIESHIYLISYVAATIRSRNYKLFTFIRMRAAVKTHRGCKKVSRFARFAGTPLIESTPQRALTFSTWNFAATSASPPLSAAFCGSCCGKTQK